ncbi:MAG: glycosyltransferase [Bacteroidaceae bacterium]|nr:glycosyltransferase [Bacteroidaceae bacterium]
MVKESIFGFPLFKRLRHALRPVRTSYELLVGKLFPKRLASIRYKQVYGVAINWSNPKNIDEKINWLKFYSDTSRWTLLADKYRVRQYVEECGFGDMLVKLYGKWEQAADIDWESLPNQFVMKTNHGSGDVLICHDKQLTDRKYWTKMFDKWLHTDFGSMMGEPHYKYIKPCVIAEELLDADKQPIASSSLIDYKIWAFNGKPSYIWCCLNRTPKSVEVITYDMQWNPHPEFSIDTPHYILTDKRIPRPNSLERMLYAASVLSKGFPQVRVDFYEVDGKAYFGEMTFTSSSGVNYFYTDEFRNHLGDHCQLLL